MWIPTHQPPRPGDRLPKERRTVLVWLAGHALPFCGYVRWFSHGPCWVVYHGNTEIGTEVVAWSTQRLTGPTADATQWMRGRGKRAQTVKG